MYSVYSENFLSSNLIHVPSFFDFTLHAFRSLPTALFSPKVADFVLHSFYFGHSQSSVLVQPDTF